MTDKKDATDELEVVSTVPQASVSEADEIIDADSCAEVEVDEPNPKRGKLLAVVVVVIFAFLGGATGAGYWAWLEFKNLRVEVAEQSSAQAQTMLDEYKRRQAEELREQLDSRQLAVDSRVDEIGSSLDTLNLRLTESEQAQPHSLVMAETQYLLNLAGNRLALEDDRDGALLALDRALDRLNEAQAPVYANLLATISAERAAVEALEAPDIAAIVSRMTQLVDSVDDIRVESEKLTPDAQTPSVESANEQGWRGIVSTITGNLTQFVTIHRADGASPPTLIPDQDYYARENVRLALKSARSAASRNDSDNFHFALSEVGRWLGHFDQADPTVSNMRAEIESLLELDLEVRYPRLTGALSVLRQLSAGGGSGVDSHSDFASDAEASTATEAAPDDAAVSDDSTAPDEVNEGELVESLEEAVEEGTNAVNELDESQQ